MRLNEKKEFVETWSQRFGEASVAILVNYSGLTANELAILRRECHVSNVHFHVVKNTLAKRALQGTNMEFLGASMRGPIGVAIGIEDQVAPAKVMTKMVKDLKKLEILVGSLDGRPLDVAGVETLSKMPGRDELRASFLGLLNNVPGGFVRLLNAVPGGMVNVLDARRRKMEEEAA
jgi:large subunit ribosomal protein L10